MTYKAVDKPRERVSFCEAQNLRIRTNCNVSSGSVQHSIRIAERKAEPLAAADRAADARRTAADPTTAWRSAPSEDEASNSQKM